MGRLQERQTGVGSGDQELGLVMLSLKCLLDLHAELLSRQLYTHICSSGEGAGPET